MVDLSMYKYPWGNIEPNEHYEVVDPITRAGWFDSEWAAQPPAIKALGKVAARRAIDDYHDGIMSEIDAEAAAHDATLTPEEIAEEERQAREEMEEIYHNDPVNSGDSRKRRH